MYEGPGLVVLLGVEEDVGKRAFLDASRPNNAAVRALAEVLRIQGKGEGADQKGMNSPVNRSYVLPRKW